MRLLSHVLRRFGDERGQALILVMGGLVAVVLMAGLTADAGNLYGNRRAAANAADAAALAGAYERLNGGGVSQAEAAAYEWAERNGFDADEVTVNVPPVSGPHAGNSNYVEVLIERDVERFFIDVLYEGEWSVSTRAVAGVSGAAAPYSILALHPNICRSIELTGSASISVQGAIHANSSCATDAIRKTGSGNVSAGSITMVGGYTEVGSGSVTPDPVQGGVVADPLANLDPPDPAGMTVYGALNIVGSSNTTISPGVYVGGISKTGSGNLTMLPGIYIMQGGGFDIQGSGNITADGVLIYNTCSTGNCATGGTSGAIDVAGSGNMTFSPPTSGDFRNVVIFQDRALTTKVDISGSGNFSGWGTVYAPVAEFEKTGSGNHTLQLIVGQFDRSGSGNLTLNYDPDAFYSAPSMRLFE